MKTNDRYRAAKVRVCDWRNEGWLQHIGRHEMLHLAHADARKFVIDLFEDYSPAEASLLRARWHELEEALVTRLERAFDDLDHIGEDGEHYMPRVADD